MGENSDIPPFVRFGDSQSVQSRNAQIAAGLGPSRVEWPAFPLNPAMSDLNLPAGVMGELEERMVALQELYEKQRQNLFLHFQQSQTQLAVQHLRCAQQLLQEYSVRNHLQSQRQQHQMVSAAAKQLQDMYYHSHGDGNDVEMSRGPSGSHRRPANGVHRPESPRDVREMYSSDERISASTSGSTTTISEGTKDKLRAMIQSKKNRQKLQSVGNSPYEGFPGVHGDDYSLRKASSEPNLKMRTVAALRAKLAPHRTSPKSPHQATPYAKPFAIPQKSSSLAEMGARRMDFHGELLAAAPSENLMDTGESTDDLWLRQTGAADRRGQFLAAAPPPNFLAAALVAANRMPTGGAGGILHQQLLRPQPLYTSPSLPEINSNAALRQLALQSSLQAAAEICGGEIPPAVLHEIFGPSAAYVSALRSNVGVQQYGQSTVALRPQNQSANRGVVGTIPAQMGAAEGFSGATDSSHGYDSLLGRNVLFAASAASSHRDAMKLLDSHNNSSLSSTASSGDFNSQAGSVASSNALKEQLRDIILRRKSLVKEETEDEVDMEIPRSRAAQYPSNLRTVSNPLPTVMERSGKHLPPSNNILFREKADEKLNKEKTENGSVGPRVSFIDVRSGKEGPSEGCPDGVLRTGLAYDTLMCKHHCLCNDNKRHLEHSGRIHSIWARLQETGLAGRCERIAARKAPMEHLKLVHTDSYANFFGTTAASRAKIDVADLPVESFTRLPCGGIGVDADTYFNDSSTSVSARMAVGCTTELTCAVAEGRLRNGFAIVRPPGHHAESQLAQGFCYFNNVAIAVKLLQMRSEANGMENRRVAILDWDVHHGNGTQSAFIGDPNVLYLSLHRYDNGQFFPGTGAISETGTGPGEGMNINIAWDGGPSMGDPEYLAAWRSVVEPVLREFQPDLIVISAGFDATSGHPSALGGYAVTPPMFGYMTKQLGRLCNDRLVLVLEGGYDLASVCDCAEESVRVLCGDPPTPFPEKTLKARPNAAAIATLKLVMEVQKQFWPGLRDDSIESSQLEWEGIAARNKFASLSVCSNSTVDVNVYNGDVIAEEQTESPVPSEVATEASQPQPSLTECRVGVIKSTKQLLQQRHSSPADPTPVNNNSASVPLLTPNNITTNSVSMVSNGGGLEVMDES